MALLMLHGRGFAFQVQDLTDYVSVTALEMGEHTVWVA